MKKIQNYVITGILIVSSFLLLSCQNNFPNSASDTTPPALDQVLVRLESSTPPNPRGEFDITSIDISKIDLDPTLQIRVIALAGDPESGITNFLIESNLTWQCSIGSGSEIIGIVENAPLAFSAFTAPSAAVTPFQINILVNPLAQTGCDTASPGKGPVNFRGYVRVTAVNGNGLRTTSKTFIFDYKNMGSL